ncbi:MAG: hypothetical protein KJP25_06380 [Gammaproteobacteria bacterium]|nr:hypothetical protein [Gammaproteobacteria bacterium]NND38359.1 hypothetical protein [Pseudomonadales bacterium]NNL10827.1 hypothetical protein [Pseudomonadales bacterium]NNM12349.1 hypothetical protein [Pseudomonadales bacterium]RZV57925.1 MAG: hypothetical protein EX270_03275 [Pseudomonadales bacterium]
MLATLMLLQPLMANAESVRVPIASQGGNASDIARPTAGMTGDRVLARFGEPLRALAPVGDPPITRWEYADFFVYFEYNHVVHAVLKHRPARARSGKT